MVPGCPVARLPGCPVARLPGCPAADKDRAGSRTVRGGQPPDPLLKEHLMAVMTDALVPALQDARQAHAAVVDRFMADATITPPGPYRQMLDQQVAEALDSLQRIEHHTRDRQPRSLLEGTIDMARFISRGVVRTAMLPLAIGSRFVTELRSGRAAHERQLLRNAEEEYAAAARAVAACWAGESIAEQIQDQATADLLGSLRRQDQKLLQTLEGSVSELARAVAVSSNGSGRSQEQDAGFAEAAAQTVRIAFDRVRDAVRTGGQRAHGAAEGAVREMPEPTRMAEEVQGAVTREEDLPIPRFSQLSISEMEQRLRTLSQSELTVIEGYERTHANRQGVLEAIEQLRGSEPLAGYDAMGPEQIVAQLQQVPVSVARQVLEYERRHRQRKTAIAAAEARVSA